MVHSCALSSAVTRRSRHLSDNLYAPCLSVANPPMNYFIDTARPQELCQVLPKALKAVTHRMYRFQNFGKLSKSLPSLYQLMKSYRNCLGISTNPVHKNLQKLRKDLRSPLHTLNPKPEVPMYAQEFHGSPL